MRPASSLELPGDLGRRAHTHLLLYVPEGGSFKGNVQPAELPPFPGYFFETPASLACLYHLVDERRDGCDPNKTTKNPSGGGGVIAIVDPYDNPNAQADLDVFSQQFGLPPTTLTVVYAQGTEPGLDPTGTSEIEESLDVQWAHAMAPNAQIVLVEAADLTFDNLFGGVIVASQIVASNGGGEVSMSWGGAEFQQETQADALFQTNGVVYVAATGDTPGTEYPSVSPYVIAAGGTSVSRNAASGRFLLENTWQEAGGGVSLYEPRPAFQDCIRWIVGGSRGVPDLSFDSNPATGVWVYDSNPVPHPGWYIAGGTSVAAPSLAGIINAAGHFRNSSQAENQDIYRHLDDPEAFRDITYGTCGLNIGSFAVPGWDPCTGVGSVRTLHGK